MTTANDNTTACAGSVTIDELPCQTIGRSREWTARLVNGYEVRIAAVMAGRTSQHAPIFEVSAAVTGETGYMRVGGRVLRHRVDELAQNALDLLLVCGPQAFLDLWTDTTR
jgi:hypothetical protein